MLYKDNSVMFLLLGAINVILGIFLSKRLTIVGSKRVVEALGARNPGLSVYKRCSMFVQQGMEAWDKRLGKGKLYRRARVKLKRAGYRGEYAPVVYMLVKYALSGIVFIIAFCTNFPDLIRPIMSVILINSILENVVASNKRRVNLRFQKHIYKIYKYLHNQISSGVKPTDAIRTVYEVTDDNELRGILVKLAARYELTLDIDIAIEEFRSNFDTHEADTLCVALKQGIDTGDNKELLARQEDIMFKKYFNYIQVETDSCRTRSVAAAGVYVAIVVAMIIIPMLDEVGQAVGKIFIN